MPQQPPLAPRKNALLDALVFGHFRVDPNVWSWYEWSTQISHRREELVVNLTKTLHPRADLILQAKPPGWLRTVAPGLIVSGFYGGPHLHPAWLMAEAVLNPQTTWWSPAPDDIDFEAIHEQNSADSIVYALRAGAIPWARPSSQPNRIGRVVLHPIVGRSACTRIHKNRPGPIMKICPL